MSKVALVTGSSRGIGASTVIEFAKNGYNVVIDYIDNELDVFHSQGIDNERDAFKLKAQVEKQYGVKAIVVKADVSNLQDVKNMIVKTVKELGKIDVLVNNAGIVFDRPFEDIELDEFERVLKVNVIGAFIVSRLACKYMKKGGAIVNVSSTNGTKVVSPESLDYNISKVGLQSLTRDLAYQFKPKIRVNAVAIGWANTSINADLPEEYINEENNKIWLNRFAKAEEVAKAICFLASEQASYINGEIITIDGGY